MKSIYVFSFILAVAAAGRYNTKYDDYNLDAVVADKAALKAFYECFVDLAPCDDVPATYKVDIPHAVAHACDECTDKQKHNMNVFATGLKTKMPQEFAVFLKKYDPEGKYFEKLAAAISKY